MKLFWCKGLKLDWPNDAKILTVVKKCNCLASMFSECAREKREKEAMGNKYTMS